MRAGRQTRLPPVEMAKSAGKNSSAKAPQKGAIGRFSWFLRVIAEISRVGTLVMARSGADFTGSFGRSRRSRRTVERVQPVLEVRIHGGDICPVADRVCGWKIQRRPLGHFSGGRPLGPTLQRGDEAYATEGVDVVPHGRVEYAAFAVGEHHQLGFVAAGSVIRSEERRV